MSSAGLQFPTLDSAIQTLEGYYPGSLSYRNRNPGNIQYGTFAQQYGGTLGAGGFAQFPDLASGTAAEDALLSLYAKEGLTVGQAASKWTGGTAPPSYAPYLASQAGASLDTPLSAIMGGTTAGSSGTGGTSSGTGTGTGGFDWWGALKGGVQGAMSATPAGVATSTLARAACFVMGVVLLIFAFRGFEATTQPVVNVVGGKLKDAVLAE